MTWDEVNEWENEWTNEWMYEWNEWMKWMNECMNGMIWHEIKRMNEFRWIEMN